MTDPSRLLDVEDLRVEFDTGGGVVTAVDGVSFVAERGRTLGIVGESGSGKSVAALTIVGLTAPNARVSGRVVLEGRDLRGFGPEQARAVRGGDVGFIFQDPLTALHPLHRIGRQIAEAVLAHRDTSKRDAGRRAIELLEMVGISDPDRRSREFPHQLSGGMRQRAMIAIAIANRPKLLIADEPTTALDVTIQARILELIKQLQADLGMGVLLITHDLGVIAEAADDVAVMRTGRIVEQGPVERIFRDPHDGHTRALLASTIRIDRPPRERSRASGPGPTPRATAGARVPLVEVEGLVKHFPIVAGVLRDRRRGEVRAVDGVSFTVAEGETLGLVGESGCGKSTLCRSMLQLIEPTSGSVRFRGREIAGAPARELRPLRREMQIIFQDPFASLNPRRPVGQIVGDPLRVHGVARGAELRRRVDELLELVGLAPGHHDRHPHELAGGQRQRIAIARALALRPSLVVADEPVSALDAPVRAQVLALLRDLQDELGLSYVLVAHDLGLVRHVADRIAVMYLGKIVEIGPAESVCSAPIHPYTLSLLSAAPIPDPAARPRRRGLPISDEVPSAADPPSACRFHTRCPRATGICAELEPALIDYGGGHLAACHHPLDADARARARGGTTSS